MIEIIPNWHPIWVKFTVGLLGIAVALFVVAWSGGERDWARQARTVAGWNLWLGTGFGVLAVISGWLAYNSVAHDAASHPVMTTHRNWALLTLGVFVLLSVWWAWKPVLRGVGTLFLVVALAGGGLLGVTGWYGGELVYRHGLGVMSLPDADDHDHDHDHHEHEHEDEHEHAPEPAPDHDHSHSHSHDHP